MKKIIALFAAALMAGSMMAEDVTEVTPPADATYEIYTASSLIITLSERFIWDATIAIKDDKMYLKGVIPFPNSRNDKWIVGTISDNEVVFASGQVVGDMDAGEHFGYLTDCRFYGVDSEREDKSTATFSWNPANKILKSVDYETVVYSVSTAFWLFFNGTFVPDYAPLTFTGTGKAPSALENTTAEVKTVKTIENGQLVIDVNGVRYDALGKMLK